MPKSKRAASNPSLQKGIRTRVAATPADRELHRSARHRITKSIDELLEQFHEPKVVVGELRDGKQTKDLQLNFERLKNASQALTTWHTDDRYLDDLGRPAALSKSGKKSLESLAKDCGTPTEQRDNLVEDLVAFGFVIQASKKFIPSNRSAVIGARSPLILAHAVGAICRLIETVSHNVAGKKPARYERQLAPVKIRKSDLPMFLNFVEQQSQYLLDAVDDWLLARSKGVHEQAETITVGIGSYAWTEKS